MREIKFRAKRLDNNDWVYGYYLYMEDQDKHYILTGKSKTYPVDSVHTHLVVEGFEWIEVEGRTVCQYTGLKDKNGVEIYEGDIVLVIYKEKRNFNGVKYEGEIRSIETVVFNEEKAAFELQICIEGVKLYRGLAIGDKVNDVELVSIEVIGNIYDNKDILEINQ